MGVLDQVPARLDYFTGSFVPPPPEHTPVITIEPWSLPAGEQLIRETRVTANGNADMVTDPHFGYDGMIEFPPLSGYESSFVATGLLIDGAPQAARYQTRVTTVMSPLSILRIKIRVGGTGTRFRIKVNGFWCSLPVMFFNGLTAGAQYGLVLTFPVVLPRRITWEDAGGTGFGGMSVELGGTLTRPANATTPFKVMVVGDSYSAGAGQPPDGAGRMETWVNFVAKLLGATSFVNIAVGGTGWLTSAGPFINRLPAIAAYAPDLLIIMGSRNDGIPAVPLLSNAVTAFLTSAEVVAVPRVIVTGPSTSSYATPNSQIKAATLAAGREFVDGLNPTPLITSADLGDDGIHPTFYAHVNKVAKGLYRRLLALGQAKLPYVPTPTILDDFARADVSGTTGATLGVTTVGGNSWGVAGAVNLGIASQQLFVYSGSISIGYAVLGGPSPRGTWQWDIPNVAAGKVPKLFFNYTGGNDHMRLYAAGANWSLDIRQTGQTTITADLGVSPANGDHVEVTRTVADLLTIKINSATVYSQTVATNNSGASFGCYGNNTTTLVRYDNVGYTPLAP